MSFRNSRAYARLVRFSVSSIARITGREWHLTHYRAKWVANRVFHFPVDLVESCLPPEKQKALLDCVERVRDVDGDIVECGVYRAGGTLLMADALRAAGSAKRILAFDSFEGMPDATEHDAMSDGKVVYEAGVLSTTSLELVTEKIRRFGHANRVSFYKGYFEQTLPAAILPGQRISMALIDCDQYSGTKFSLEHLYDKVSPGGMLLFDDYDAPVGLDTPGVKVAVTEFLHGKPEEGKVARLGGSLYGVQKSAS